MRKGIGETIITLLTEEKRGREGLLQIKQIQKLSVNSLEAPEAELWVSDVRKEYSRERK